MYICQPIGLSDDQIARLLRALPKPEPPPSLHLQVGATIRAERQRQRAYRRCLFAFATAFHLLVFVLWERAAG